MSKPSVILTRPIHVAGIEMLQKHFNVTVHPDSTMSVASLKKVVKGADAIVSLLTEKISDEIMEAAGPQLKIIANYAVGYDNIDLEAAKKRLISVTNTPGVLSGPAVAEQVFNLMFAVGRHTIEADNFMRSGKYKQWNPNLFLGKQLAGKTVGIIGSGQIGSIFAGMCHNGLRMKVLYNDVRRNEKIEKDLGATKTSLEQLLIHADVISIHVPLLPSTHHLIGKEQLYMMKPGAILINTSRGPVIEEKALVEALKKNHLYGAGLDVYENEPKMSPGLAKLSNVVLSPHIGSATEEARIAMAQCVARNVQAVLSGQAALNPISA